MTNGHAALILLLFFGALLFFGGCAPDAYCNLQRPEVSSQEAFIVHGERSTDPRSTVKVEFDGAYCTGTIVGPRTVLTAAHCMLRNNREPIFVRSEQNNRSYIIVDHLVHPEYNGEGASLARTFEGDILLVYVHTDIEVGQIPVAETPNGCYPDLIAQGYGRDENDNGGVLRERVVYEVDRNRRRSMIWTTAACNFGDSGGPLYAETPEGLTVIGALSARRNGPSDKDCLYVDLFDAKSWIEENSK